MGKRLLIDLNACDACAECTVQCAYFYQPGATEHGILALRELVTFALVCRRCEEPSCAAACRFEALERQDDGVMKRHNMRCVSCKCCSQACPFGTISPDTIPFYVSRCDVCLGSTGAEPACVLNCVKNAIAYQDVDAAPADVHLLGEHVAVRAPRWDRKDV